MIGPGSNKNWFDCHFHFTFDQVLLTFFRSYTMKMDATQGQTTLGRETSICIKFLVFKIISIKSIISCLSIIIFIQLVISLCLSSQFCNLVIDLDGQIIPKWMTNPNPWSVKSKTFGRQCWLGIFIDCSLSFNEQIPKVNWIILIPDTQKYQVIHSILHRAKDQAWNQQSTLTCSRHYQQQVVHQVRHLCGVLKGNLCHDDCRWDSWPDRKHNCNHRSFKVNCVHTVW